MIVIRSYLLDLNLLLALVDSGHQQHQTATEWFEAYGKFNWGFCPLTETAFLRVAANPAYRPEPNALTQAIAVLRGLKEHHGFLYWEIDKGWIELTAPFAARINGHRQIMDAYLLGLAIEKKGVLVTFNKGTRALAGEEFQANVLLLGS